MANTKRVPLLTGYGIFNARGRMVEGPFDTENEACGALAGETIAARGGDPVEDLELTVEPIRLRGVRS